LLASEVLFPSIPSPVHPVSLSPVQTLNAAKSLPTPISNPLVRAETNSKGIAGLSWSVASPLRRWRSRRLPFSLPKPASSSFSPLTVSYACAETRAAEAPAVLPLSPQNFSEFLGEGRDGLTSVPSGANTLSSLVARSEWAFAMKLPDCMARALCFARSKIASE
jgi:hypothetical protein